MNRHWIFLLVVMQGWTAQAAGEETVPTESTESASIAPEGKNILHAEVATIGLAGALSINYERLISEHWTFRVGVGVGYLVLPIVILMTATEGTGTQLMFNYLCFDSNHHLELGFGLSAMYVSTTGLFVLSLPVGGNSIELFPSLSLAYRYQPRTSGFFFRAGAMWSYGFGVPMGMSLGFVF